MPSLLDLLDAPYATSSLTIAPSVYPQARETSALAAVENLPARGKQNALVLQLITAAGEAGMSDPELEQATGLSRASICLRRHDLRAFLRPAERRAKSKSGRLCVCWRRATKDEMQEAGA